MAIRSDYRSGDPVLERLGGEVVVAQKEINFATLLGAVADVIEIMTIPAGAFVTNVWSYINTAEGGVATGDVGDGTDPNGYNDALDLNAAAGTVEKCLEADALSVGKYYAAEDTIDLTLDHECDTGIVTFIVEYVMLENVS